MASYNNFESNRTSTRKQSWKAFILAFAIFVTGLSSARGSESIVRPFEYVIQLETVKLKRKFPQGTDSQHHDVVKVKTTYWRLGEENNPKDYEDLYFMDDQLFGIDRHENFSLPPGVGIEIKVKEASAGVNGNGHAVEASSAKSAIRMLVDSYLNRNPVARVIVPDLYYEQFSSTLNAQHFVRPDSNAPDVAVHSPINIFVQNQSNSQSQTLYYIR